MPRAVPAARRHAITVLGGARRHGSARSSRITAVAAVLSLALVLVVVGTIGTTGLAAVGTMHVLSADLPSPADLSALTFDEPTLVYDRTGKVLLAQLGSKRRTVVRYDEIPPVVIDATVAAEDRSFWSNDGYDVKAMIVAALETLDGDPRGASTITQQLVRARMLPADVVAPGANLYLRKAKEIIQAARVTADNPGLTGKQQIIAAYLNQIYYGHNAYGIAAAARVYFGVTDLAKLTPAQAALLAALPQSPSQLDPYRSARRNTDGQLVVDPASPVIVRRNWILANLAHGHLAHLTSAETARAASTPAILAGDPPIPLKAPQFTWQVVAQLRDILGSTARLETGGYRVITTLDWHAQQLAVADLAGSLLAPNMKRKAGNRLLARLDLPKTDRAWMKALRGKDLHNGALVAIDYRTGDVRAYVGSAGYNADNLRSAKFDPKFDAAGVGARQPGSAWKAVLYATAFDRKVLTPGSLLLDITTDFAPAKHWAPRDADQRDRGPVLVRDALQQSLNIPAIRALERVGSAAVARTATAMGIRFRGGPKSFEAAGLAGAIGTVEVTPLDLTTAYATIANGGVHLPTRMVLEVKDRDGNVVWKAPEPEGQRAISAQAAYLVTDILAGNTDPSQNPIWAKHLELRNGAHGKRRPAAVKTGTSNEARDLSTYGFLAPPDKSSAPAWVVGIWMGNSDGSTPHARRPATSLTAAAPLWRLFMKQVSNGDPVARFDRPPHIKSRRIDAFSGGSPGPWTRATTHELFIAGTQPGARHEIDQAGLLYTRACGRWAVDPLKAELGPAAWNGDVRDWMRRARAGVGVRGKLGSRTGYLLGRHSWGGPIDGPCPTPKPTPTPSAPPSEAPSTPPGPGPTPPPAPGPTPSPAPGA